MSVQSAKQFILSSTNKNAEFKNILENTSSKFESTDAKLEYITEKAKNMGFNFNSTELKTALKEINSLPNQDLSKIAGGGETNSTNNSIDTAKNFWNSLW